MPVGVCDLVAVTVVAASGVSGEASSGGIDSLGLGAVEASARALEVSDAVTGEIRDVERADAISTIAQLRQRMNATEL